MNGKKAVLVVSFGTSYTDALEGCIAPTEAAIAAALPGRDLRRAFTSGMIMQKLERRDGLVIDDVPRALTRLLDEGYDDVVIQPTHIMNGEEYDKLAAQAAPLLPRFGRAVLGEPLLTVAEDYRAAAEALMAELPPTGAGEALVLMGHGSEHFANAAYALLEYVLHDLGWKDAFVGTVEGYPALEQVMARLAERSGIDRVLLCPFMVVAGDHARNDMAGEEPDSWKSRLEAAGYTVACMVRGLGQLPGVRARFAAHAREAAGLEESV